MVKSIRHRQSSAISILLILVLAVVCYLLVIKVGADTSSPPRVTQPRLNRPFTLRVGTPKSLRGGRTTLTLVKVIEDTRCPADVVCLAPGEARIELQVVTPTESKTVNLALYTSPFAQVGDYRIRFNKLYPSRQAGVESDPTSYRAQVYITKLVQKPTQSFTSILTGDTNSSTGKAEQRIISSEADWQSLWKTLHAGQTPTPAAPSVDFGREQIIALIDSSHPTGGYSIAASNVTETETTLTLEVTRTSPSPACVTTAAFTQPYQLIKIAKTTKSILFTAKENVTAC